MILNFTAYFEWIFNHSDLAWPTLIANHFNVVTLCNKLTLNWCYGLFLTVFLDFSSFY